MPPANDLTIVVTTSPIPSIPSTALLEALFASLDRCVPQLACCQAIIVCDGIGTVLGSGETPNWKCSKVNPLHVGLYAEYVQNVQRLAHAQKRRPCTVLALNERRGCGLAVDAALASVVTPFVMVVQHDQLFLRGFDVLGVLGAMHSAPTTLRYISLQSRTTLHYSRRVAERFGFQLTELRQAPLGSPLLPLLMWYDKPHIVWTDYLRTRVYASGILRPGDFVEDVFGRAQMEDIKKHGMDAHSRYGTWVLCDDDTSPVTYHLSGRKVLAQQATATPRHAAEEACTTSIDAVCAAGGGAATSTAHAIAPLVAAPIPPSSSTASSSWDWAESRRSIHASVPGLAPPVCTAQPGGDPAAPPDLSTRRFRGVCFRCQTKGHSFRHCPLNSDSYSSDQQSACAQNATR
jgi:hypothetical protein